MFTLLGMAAFLFGLAVLLVIGFNWEATPGRETGDHSRRGICSSLGLTLRVRAKAPRLSEVVFFLGCLFYGAGIWLVAQAFHIEAHYPDGVWWWAVGVLPFALCLDSLLCHLLFVALMALWAGMEVLGFVYLSPWFLFGWWQWPNGAYSLPLLALPGLLWAYRKGSPVAVGLYVALLSWWLILQAFAVADRPLRFLDRQHRGRTPHPRGGSPSRQRIGHSVPPLGRAVERWCAHPPQLHLLLAVCNKTPDLLAVLPGTFSGSFGDYGGGRHFDPSWHLHHLARPREEVRGTRRLRLETKRANYCGGSGFRLVWQFAWPHWRCGALPAPDAIAAWAAPAVLANVAMLSLAVYLIRVGVHEERVRPFAAGVLYFLIWAFARYIDLFMRRAVCSGPRPCFSYAGRR